MEYKLNNLLRACKKKKKDKACKCRERERAREREEDEGVGVTNLHEAGLCTDFHHFKSSTGLLKT